MLMYQQAECRRRGSWSRPASAVNYQTVSTTGRHGFSSAQSSPLQSHRAFL